MTISQMGESAIIEYAAATTMPETAEACFNVTVMCPFGIFRGVPLGGWIFGLSSASRGYLRCLPDFAGGHCGYCFIWIARLHSEIISAETSITSPPLFSFVSVMRPYVYQHDTPMRDLRAGIINILRIFPKRNPSPPRRRTTFYAKSSERRKTSMNSRPTKSAS